MVHRLTFILPCVCKGFDSFESLEAGLDKTKITG